MRMMRIAKIVHTRNAHVLQANARLITLTQSALSDGQEENCAPRLPTSEHGTVSNAENVSRGIIIGVSVRVGQVISWLL